MPAINGLYTLLSVSVEEVLSLVLPSGVTGKVRCDPTPWTIVEVREAASELHPHTLLYRSVAEGSK